jgi:nicotinamide-nucleotide amidase
MKAALITIGNELLIGDIINTNAAWMGTFLTQRHLSLVYSITIGDDADAIVSALDHALEAADVVLITGGLGPTHDDITKHILADYTGGKLVEHQETRDSIVRNFNQRGIPISDSNLQQALVPDSAELLFNSRGTAPGMWFDLKRESSDRKGIIVSMPGVPTEMKHLMERKVWPKLSERLGKNGVLYRHYLNTAGIGESTLSDLTIGDISGMLKDGVELAYLPHTHGVGLRITATGPDEEAAAEKARPLLEYIRDKAGDFIYSEIYDEDLPKSCGKILQEKKLTVATAESCTGGLIGSLITDVPGSSAWYRGSIVAYHNELKTRLLNVPESTLAGYGAVSKETALIMAKSAAESLDADIGLATTGIAGPGGGSEEKPVGLVWFGYYDEDHHFAIRAQFFKNRKLNKERTALVALDMMRRVLCDITRMPYDARPQTA